MLPWVLGSIHIQRDHRTKLDLHETDQRRGLTVEYRYWTEPKTTCHPHKSKPNAYNLYIDLEGIRLLGYVFMSASRLGW